MVWASSSASFENPPRAPRPIIYVSLPAGTGSVTLTHPVRSTGNAKRQKNLLVMARLKIQARAVRRDFLTAATPARAMMPVTNKSRAGGSGVANLILFASSRTLGKFPYFKYSRLRLWCRKRTPKGGLPMSRQRPRAARLDRSIFERVLSLNGGPLLTPRARAASNPRFSKGVKL